MKIAIIGNGNVGNAVAHLLVKAGHEVRFGIRDKTKQDSCENNEIPLGTIEEAIAFGEVILCAVPFGAWPQLAEQIVGAVSGKIVIDAANPNLKRDGETARSALALKGGAGEMVAKLLPQARLVRTFSTIEAHALAREAGRNGPWLGLPVAGDDSTAVQTAAGLVRDVGFEPVIVGLLASARQFDSDTAVFNSGMTGQEVASALGVV